MRVNKRLRKLESKINTELIKVYFKDGSTEIVSDLRLVQMVFPENTGGKEVDYFEVVGKENEELCTLHKMIKAIFEI